jgi:hypothetical protein
MIRRCLARRIVLAALVHRERRAGRKVTPATRRRLEHEARLYVSGRLRGWPREPHGDSGPAARKGAA